MYLIGLIVEYSRMKVPSLSSGCEIAQFFVHHTVATDGASSPSGTVALHQHDIMWRLTGEQNSGVSTIFGRQNVQR